MDLSPLGGQPKWLGRYEILRRLGEGGMGEVYLARATGVEGFEKILVLKRLLRPLVSSDQAFLRMFLDEARLAASLNHPNIAQVYDMGCEEGDYFYAMEYIHGEDLRAVMRRSDELGRAIPLDQAVAVAIAIAAGLHYAHERTDLAGKPLRIVHRDVSPSNVLISYDGATKVVDFGLAKAVGSEDRTQTGMIKGKLAYMSLEQGRGQPLDRRTDVFSLGLILWELLTGRPQLLRGGGIDEVLARTVVAPSTHRAEVGAELDRIVLRSVARDREARYPTAQAMQVELEEYARRERLVLSTVALKDWMTTLFGDKAEAWRLAELSGVTLSAYVIGLDSTLVAPPPPSESGVSAATEVIPEPQTEVVEATTDVVSPPAPVAFASGASLTSVKISGPPLAVRRMPTLLVAAGMAIVAVAIALAVAMIPGSDVEPARTPAPSSPGFVAEPLPAPVAPPAPSPAPVSAPAPAPSPPAEATIEPVPGSPPPKRPSQDKRRRRPAAQKTPSQRQGFDPNSPVPW